MSIKSQVPMQMRQPVSVVLKQARKFLKAAGVSGVRLSVVQEDNTPLLMLHGTEGARQLARHAIEIGYHDSGMAQFQFELPRQQ